MGDSTQDFCFTCLKAYAAKEHLISLNFVPAEDISYKVKLKSCIPEMILEKPDDYFLCNPCLKSLEIAYTFRCMCLRNEGKFAECKQNYNKPIQSKFHPNIKIKQEVIETMNVEETPETIFVEVASVPNEAPIVAIPKKPPVKSKNSSLKKEVKDPNSFNPFGSEVELLRIDNSVKSNVTPLPKITTRRMSELIIQQFQTDKPEIVKNNKSLSDIEIIEIACKTIPELINYKCDVQSLDCRVSLRRVDDDCNDVVKPPPVKKLFKRKYIKKHKKKFGKGKKDVNYWCHICVKFIAIGRRHRYTAHMLNHKNIKSYKCEKCSKEFTYGETLSKHRRDCNGVLPAQKTFQILPSNKIKTEDNRDSPKVTKKLFKFDLKKVKKEPYDVDNDWTDEARARKYLKIENSSDADAARRSGRTAKPVSNQAYNASNDVYHCEICEYQTYKKHQYQVHMMKHFNDRRFECTKCPKRFFENWELNRHLRTVHLSSAINRRPPPNSYDINNIKPLLPQQTNVSEQTDDTNDSESTVFAKMLEPSVSLTVNHEAVVTPVIQSIESLAEDVPENAAISFACKVCNASFKSHNLLMAHSHTHKARNQCNVCGQMFISNVEFLEHVKSHSSDYNNVIELIETHVPPKLPPKKKKKKKFFCTICNLEFASKDHANIHTGAKPYDCKVCGKEFAAYSTLRKHRWTHSDDLSQNGEDCEETDVSQVGPQRLKHTCEICGKTFMNKWQVNSHTCHSATGEAVYRCQICKNAFVGRTALIEHMGVHVNQAGDYYQ